jgi:REP element-mobilizing transposase RayT
MRLAASVLRPLAGAVQSRSLPIALLRPFRDATSHTLRPEAAVPQSLARNLVHLIFSTKHRVPVLSDRIRDELHAYMAGVLKEWDSPALEIGSVADHVHILFCLSKNHALAKVVEHVKKGPSKWLKTQGREFADFHWQAGYGAFSVSQSNVPRVRTYIQGQAEHHRRRTFQDEFRAFLKRHQVEYDERYVWD